MEYQYTYLLMALLFFFIWIFLFLRRKDTRKEMLIMSLIFSFAGPLADILYVQDWWHPFTITNTQIGIESLVTAFMIGGISSIIYVIIFKKKLSYRKVQTSKKKKILIVIFTSLLTVLLFLGGFYIFHLDSLFSTILALTTSIFLIWMKRRDLIMESIITGLLLLTVSIIVYSCLEILTPGWIPKFWVFKNIPNIIILNVPINDIIWYFLAGAFIGPLYEYWRGFNITKP